VSAHHGIVRAAWSGSRLPTGFLFGIQNEGEAKEGGYFLDRYFTLSRFLKSLS